MQKGVYDIHWGSQQVRIIVLSEVPKVKRHALWLMFSGIAENVQYGASQYNWRQPDLSTVINELFEFYQVEGTAMPYTVEDYRRERKERALELLTPEDILQKISLEELLKRLPPEERLKGFAAGRISQKADP